MKITAIEMFPVEVPVIPVAEGGIAPYWGSQDKVGTTRVTSLLFKVSTDEGITGWGEMNPIISTKVTAVLLDDYIKPLVIGRNPFDLKPIMKQFNPGSNPQINTKSFLTGVEMACWDIMGKSVNKPVYELLGGKFRDSIEIAYALGMLDIAETKEKIAQIKAEGYRTLKTKGGKDVLSDIKRAIAIREAGGDEFQFRVDMNMGYDTPTALRYLHGVEDCYLQFVEQPIKYNKFDDLKSLRDRSLTPIGINEDCYIPGNLLEAVKRGCIDVAIVDFEALGGISELIRLDAIAHEANLSLAHHCGWDMGVKLAAILHATCTMPAFTFPMDSTYMAHGDDILKDRIKISDGSYLVPEGPGLGVEIDEEKLTFLSVNGCN
ncbi:mandelate racemase/muconate lactonizing enzyme family protein [Paenibacillus eucommiae]|uniref:L-alanine-DL-glutamate epimerase-like enolase superfamily enzyme n=1 Tax=Paenibacillus eucommiae TaxID=1355755 RepID=A0ABS4J812_9BACL|nr:mandelate racemase/muconate lactonizing enzyme family protein [Paenibacillus eucommiae]MBP1995991.1 L-alanine-DL-glutamate epimerase-like enolase superfamily enzyme [Paenibacillus eucommiae]